MPGVRLTNCPAWNPRPIGRLSRCLAYWSSTRWRRGRTGKGFLRLSLVTCAVALFPATSESEKVSFNQINRNTGHRIKYAKVDAATGEKVSNEDIIKGYRSTRTPTSPATRTNSTTSRSRARAPSTSTNLSRSSTSCGRTTSCPLDRRELSRTAVGDRAHDSVRRSAHSLGE